MHGKRSLVEMLAFHNLSRGQLFEGALGYHKVDLVRDLVDQRREDQRVVVHEAVRGDHQIDLTVLPRSSTFDLKRYVSAVGHPMHHRVEPAVQQRQEHVQGALRLLDQIRPDLEFHCLARTNGVPPCRHQSLVCGVSKNLGTLVKR